MRRFEKSLYDLIRGLRNHKGNEKEYIQKTLKECRAEVRSQDMDLKATALLKLIYLEMVGHDMSWASFHVLEVMSSPKYHQKRVGYLGAVQSFRHDTEVLMLATNLLKKDLAATSPTVISLPIATLPHVITPSLALSTLADLLPRLNHSHANIRKKTLVTLYRLALVYPEALRAAWPKIKDRLMDPNEDPSVTAAIVNVVCELGSRRPNDFLPLAPRLFELLVDSGNNWMAIKLIKLANLLVQFASLTPLEPRLVRKLLPPLTNIIRTTPAMSLLYECINGIIQGGILDSAEDVAGADEIATLCVNKLRGMIMINGDANLKYVALLAFNKIVLTHPHLVSQQEDVILECIDSSDITIRVQALNLVKGMVSSDNLVPVVSRLMKQLKSSLPSKDRRVPGSSANTPETESDDEAQTAITAPTVRDTQALLLPDDYRIDIIERILYMCSKDNYSSVLDFDWYIDVLTQLVRMAPVPRTFDADTGALLPTRQQVDVAEKVGDELRNVAVKVRAMRATAVRAADLILDQLLSENPVGHSLSSGALKSAIWIIGEYAIQLAMPDDSLNGLLQAIPRIGKAEILAVALHATAKVFSSIAGSELEPWTAERKSRISLLLARILDVLEPLALHPSLEVQERAVEFIELLKLTAEAVSGQPPSTDENHQEPPLLLTQAIPSLFTGWELNSVAVHAQKNVPLPDGLDLDEPIHGNLGRLLSQTDIVTLQSDEADDFEVYYHQRPPPSSLSSSTPAISRLADPEDDTAGSYQQPSEESYLDADILAKRKAERMEKNKDDPFYIPSDNILRTSTPIHNILQNNNGPALDIDSIPVMQLDLDKIGHTVAAPSRPRPQPRQRVVVATDETLEGSDSGTGRQYDSENSSLAKARSKKSKQHSLLQVDSSTIGSFSLEGNASEAFDYERQQREEAEMQQAMKEVERLRLEMQRANERIQMAQGADVQGVVIKKKTKKKATAKKAADGDEAEATKAKPRKKVKKAAPQAVEGGGDDTGGAAASGTPPAKAAPKKKKKKKPAPVEEAEGAV
ncbi:AP-3 complex subunit delta [Trichoderma ghanense]|uniref:AP-3 complex subunit delta n=1 Tax=Trichoderma ghanense TaxID=65468 RepID=A0ABY2H974_9HYPO